MTSGSEERAAGAQITIDAPVFARRSLLLSDLPRVSSAHQLLCGKLLWIVCELRVRLCVNTTCTDTPHETPAYVPITRRAASSALPWPRHLPALTPQGALCHVTHRMPRVTRARGCPTKSVRCPCHALAALGLSPLASLGVWDVGRSPACEAASSVGLVASPPRASAPLPPSLLCMRPGSVRGGSMR